MDTKQTPARAAGGEHGLSTPNGRLIHDHLLSVTLMVLFLLSLAGQMFFQYREVVDEAVAVGAVAPAVMSREFLDPFLAAVFENWQSEFLQLLTFVVLAAYLIHRGSPQSRDSEDEIAADVRAIRRKLEA
ncbi:MAG TPA: DUF6766 family protein [Acidimicrobiia bacterium]